MLKTFKDRSMSSWCHQGFAFIMSANLEDPTVATGLEKVNPHPNSQEKKWKNEVAQLCPTLWDPMDGSTPGLPVHHHLPEFTQTHVHWFGDAIQPSHPLSSPSPPAFRVFSNESALWVRWPKYWSFSFSISPSSEYSGLISFRTDWFDLLLDWLTHLL